MEQATMEPIETPICHAREDGLIVRGYRQDEICGNLTYTETLFLTLRGRLPSTAETKVLDAVLNGMIGYDIWTVGRIVASANSEVWPAFVASFMAGGRYTIFPQHGAEFIGQCYEQMKRENLSREEMAVKAVEKLDREKQRLHGVGHPLYKRIDPRAEAIRKVAEKYGFIGEKTLLFEAIHAEYIKNPRRSNLCLNIDGRFACTLLELGFTPPETTIIAILSLTPGVLADISHQLQSKPSLALMLGFPFKYVGPPEQKLPKEYIRH